MGFGFLFMGYFITFFIAPFVPYGFAFQLTGVALMIKALHILKDYQRDFICTSYMTLPLVLGAIYRGAAAVCVALGADEFSLLGRGVDDVILSVFLIASVIGFHVCLLRSIRRLATDLELEKIRESALFNLIAVAVYALVYLACGILPRVGSSVLTELTGYLGLPLILLQLAWTILNLVLLYRCHMYICPEGEEDMPRKPSRIPFINRLDEELERREERALKRTLDDRRRNIRRRQAKIEAYKKTEHYQKYQKKKKK